MILGSWILQKHRLSSGQALESGTLTEITLPSETFLNLFSSHDYASALQHLSFIPSPFTTSVTPVLIWTANVMILITGPSKHRQADTAKKQ